MTRDELTALARGLAPIVSEHITKAYGVLTVRMDVLEQRMASVKDGRDGAEGVPGRDGTSFTTGIGSPTFDGRQGDVYLDAKTGDIYRCL